MRWALCAALASCCIGGWARAEDKVGDRHDGGTVVPTQQLVRPAGDALYFPGGAVDLVVSRDAKAVYVKGTKALLVVDADKWTVRQELRYPSAGGSMHGIALSHDGKRLFVGGSVATLWVADVAPDGSVKWAGNGIDFAEPPSREEKKRKSSRARGALPCGVALSADDKTAYVCLSISNELAVVDLATMKVTANVPVGVAPFGAVLSPDGRTAYVSNWGGRQPKQGDHTALSAGTPTVINEHGVASTGTVGVVDLRQGKMTREIAVGLHPADMALDRTGKALYVANANSDTVSVIDTATATVTRTLSSRPDATLPFGSASNALALSPDEKTLYVANGGNNAVAVMDLSSGKPTGFIPTGWYPGAVACDGNRLFIVNVKGDGSRDAAKVKTGWNSTYTRGGVSRVNVPDADGLARYTKQVMADARIPEVLRAQEKAQAGVAPVPVPTRVGEPSVFEHVVYVIKENRTYDQVFGDMKQGNGNADLCIFGRKVSPNHHAIAEQFALLDNFYCNGVISADGHQWATQADAADGIEKTTGGWTRSYPFTGDDPLAFVSTGFLWSDALAHGLSFRNYGEMSSGHTVPQGVPFAKTYQDHVTQAGKVHFSTVVSLDELRKYTCPDYPGWNLAIPDASRLDVFLREFKRCEADGHMPNLTIVYLPSDHTRGAAADGPTPNAMVADNDLAVGKLLEALSHSAFWPKTCMFVIEDDPQNGFDHVDGHRSLCLVASPYTRRHATVSAFYNQTSVLHTMELILGLPPMNQLDAMAPVMRECFTDKPDVTPYAAVPNEIPLDQMAAKQEAMNGPALAWSRKSLAQRLDQPDQVDDDTFNRAIWFATKGSTAPYPAEFAGAHGKGLAKLHLKVDGAQRVRDDDD